MDKNGFTDYLQAKDLAQATWERYLLLLEYFFKWAKKEDIQVTKPDILKYLEYLKRKRGLQNITRNNHLIALKHYFAYLYQNEQIATNPCLFLKIRGTQKKMLYKIYTSDELDTLFDNYYHYFVRAYDDSHIPKNQRKQAKLNRQRNAVILSVLVNQGISVSEIEKIELGDLDLIKATIKIKGARRANDRTLPLKATQIGVLLDYLQNIRPQLLEYQRNESQKLFLPLPSASNKTAKNDSLKYAVKPITKQIEIIDKQFINFYQIRASVITLWLKAHGLRKTQYLAGHKSICSTEMYTGNNLDNLIDDISKMHPF
jgi:site-specific recombinase XerD